MAVFARDHRKEFHYLDGDLNDFNYPHPSFHFEWELKLMVYLCEQVQKEKTTHEERMAFSDANGAVYPGVQGLVVVYKQLLGMMPESFWTASLDQTETGRLWKDSNNVWRIPTLSRSNGADNILSSVSHGMKYGRSLSFLLFRNE